jgi:hypothetical protein
MPQNAWLRAARKGSLPFPRIFWMSGKLIANSGAR